MSVLEWKINSENNSAHLILASEDHNFDVVYIKHKRMDTGYYLRWWTDLTYWDGEYGRDYTSWDRIRSKILVSKTLEEAVQEAEGIIKLWISPLQEILDKL